MELQTFGSVKKDSVYLTRYALKKTYLSSEDYKDVGTVVVIPACNEPDIISSLESLEACSPTNLSVAVIVIINSSESASEKIKQANQKAYEALKRWQSQRETIHRYYFILENELPAKHAGVGLARKLGMDEAVRIFKHVGRDGVILCFDADSLCQANLLKEVEELFADGVVPGCSIHFEHPLDGNYDEAVYEGIINYELHLRYFVNAQRWAGFPYAYQTIGSSMAVRSSVYERVGGMNRRKAGEDFYFLHKVIPITGFKELNSTQTIPSPRVSDRVPFGTGKAIGDWIQDGKTEWATYSPESFKALKCLFKAVDKLYGDDIEVVWKSLPQVLQRYISEDNFVNQILEFRNNSSSLESFEKRFYQWFDAFQLMKFVHFSRDNYFPNVSLREAAVWLLDDCGQEYSGGLKVLLELFRDLDRNQSLFNLSFKLTT